MVAPTLQYLEGLTASAATIWFAFWAIRSKYELDYPLDRGSRTIRWGMIAIGFFLALLRAPEFKPLRLLGGVLYLGFLCWPNFAYHLSRLFRRRNNRDNNNDEGENEASGSIEKRRA